MMTLVDDVAFDERLPASLQLKASVHFTPVGVARQAARWLAPESGASVLDVGAGAGKFCLVAAHEVPHARFAGVELRPHLVRIASRLASELALPNVEFIHGDAFDLDWSAFDAFYFFNPFAEEMFQHAFVLDREIELDPANFIAHVASVVGRLVRARAGTRVVTYHGFGADPPLGFELVASDGELALWIKRAARRARRGPRVDAT